MILYRLTFYGYSPGRGYLLLNLTGKILSHFQHDVLRFVGKCFEAFFKPCTGNGQAVRKWAFGYRIRMDLIFQQILNLILFTDSKRYDPFELAFARFFLLLFSKRIRLPAFFFGDVSEFIRL